MAGLFDYLNNFSSFFAPQQVAGQSAQLSGGGGGGSAGGISPSVNNATSNYMDSYDRAAAKITAPNPQPTGTRNTNQVSVPSQPDPTAQLRNQIGSGWDQYLASLDSQLGGLSDSRSAQENIVNSQYGQGMSDLGLQYGQGQQQLADQRTQTDTNQIKTLRDISSNIRNSFQAGNNLLGSRGASDSSAADQYSYALTKLGSKQRGDVMAQTAQIKNEIAGRETNLKNIFDNETRRLTSERDQKVNQIAQWFAEAQNQIRQAQATGQLNKSQDLANVSRTLLNNALGMLNQVQTGTQGQLSALQQWATQNAQTVQQQKAQLEALGSQQAGQVPGAQPLIGNPTFDQGGNLFAPVGFGGQTVEKNPLNNIQGWNWLSSISR